MVWEVLERDNKMDNEGLENKDEVLEQEAEAKEAEELDKKNHAKLVDIVNSTLDFDEEKEEEVLEKEEKEGAEEKEEEVLEKKEREVDDNSTKKDKSDTTKKDEVNLSDLKLNPRLLQAAKRSHISDEDIITMGENAGLVLGKLADNLDVVSERLGAIGQQTKISAKPAVKEEVAKTTFKLSEEMAGTELGKQLQGVIGGLANEISGLKEQLFEKDVQSTKVNLQERDQKIDIFFDGVGKDYVEFGDSKTLTNAEIVMRQNLWEKADDIMVGSQLNGASISLDEALQQAMSIYEGKNPQRVKEKLIDEVKKREKSLLSKPTSKKGKVTEPMGDEQAVSAVKNFFKERGQDGW